MEPAKGEEKGKRILREELAFETMLCLRRPLQHRPGGQCLSLPGVSAATLWAGVKPKCCKFKD